jgi:hypothetical protein
MKDEMMWKKHRGVMTDINMSIAFSVFGMLLIFGLGFVFPTIDPYVVIKWIIIVAAAMFVLALFKYVGYWVMKMRMMGGWKKAKRGERK